MVVKGLSTLYSKDSNGNIQLWAPADLEFIPISSDEIFIPISMQVSSGETVGVCAMARFPCTSDKNCTRETYKGIDIDDSTCKALSDGSKNFGCTATNWCTSSGVQNVALDGVTEYILDFNPSVSVDGKITVMNNGASSALYPADGATQYRI